MSVLSDSRAALQALLDGQVGVDVFSVIPDRAHPPLIAVAPDFPYVEYPQGDPTLAYGEALVRHRLTLIVGPGDNDTEADDLDDLIVQVLGLDFGAHVVQQVDEPGPAPLNGQVYLGVNIRLATTLNL